MLKETLPINHRKFPVTTASCKRSKCITGKVTLVQGSLAGDLEPILGSLELHNLPLQQLGEVSQAVIFTGSKCSWKLPCSLVQCPASASNFGSTLMPGHNYGGWSSEPTLFLDTLASLSLCSFTQAYSGTLSDLRYNDTRPLQAHRGSNSSLFYYLQGEFSLWIYFCYK